LGRDPFTINGCFAYSVSPSHEGPNAVALVHP